MVLNHIKELDGSRVPVSYTHLHAVSHLIEDHAKEAQIPIRFAASKIIEGDHLILEKLRLDENEKEARCV